MTVYTLGAILATIIATVIVANIANRVLLTYFRVISERLKVEETVYTLIRRIIVALVYFAGIIIIIDLIPQLRSISTALLAGAGVAGIVVGMAAHSTLSNVISGISLAISHPFRIGDALSIRDEYGTVEDITLRHTVIKTWENKRLIIPNSIISDEAVVNWSIGDLPVLWHVDFGIAYDADIDHARLIILDEIDKHPDVMHDRDSRVMILELADFSVNLRTVFWVRDRPTAWGTGCDIRESVKKRFDKEGIEIPFPYRTIVYKKDLEIKDEDKYSTDKL